MKPVAKKDDHVVAVDIHLCSGALTPVPFDAQLDQELSPDVLAEHLHVAVVGSKATKKPVHVPPPGTTFDIPPHKTATVVKRKATVFANHKALARHGDEAETCNDANAPLGKIVASSSVLVGG